MWLNINRGALLGASLSAFALSACSGISDCEGDPAACATMLNENATACAEAFQLKHTERKRKYCEQAIDVVGDAGTEAAVPGLLGILAVGESGVHDDNHRQEAAKALGEIGSASATDGLVSAIDYEAGTGSDPRDKMANRANEAIATSLGAIGEAKAVDPLLKLIEESRDNYVVLKAVRALGEIGDASAVDDLSEIAINHSNKFMRKNATVALGEIGHPSAIDALIQMMFIEYQGVSFYREASFALYKIGPAAADELLATMALENEKVNDIFEKSGGLKESAIKAKCGFVLGDLRDPRAVEPLLEAFKAAADPNKFDPVVLTYAAPPLAALGDERAVSVIQEQMGTIDGSVRDPLMQAMVMIGSQEPVDEMLTAMTREDFVKKCTKMGASAEACIAEEQARRITQEVAAQHVSNLASGEHLKRYQEIAANEPDEKIKKYMTERIVRLEVAKECGSDAGCWAKKLKDDNELVRERSAWQLKRLKDPSTLDALADALDDKNRETRYAAIQAYWAFGDARAIDQIKETLKKEASSADFVKVNEDLKRLLVHLERTNANA